jgi:hypothetical protein
MSFLGFATWSSDHFWAPYNPSGLAEEHLALTGPTVHPSLQDVTQFTLGLWLGYRRNKRTEGADVL